MTARGAGDDMTAEDRAAVGLSDVRCSTCREFIANGETNPCGLCEREQAILNRRWGRDL